ncbi:MAG: thiamine pyrophosphate-dependent enzyme [Deltaproteobacteria bacterium]|nr:thiamine pyrophosphate-dependent enzyme [Deltaproteobacteria bacterium]MDZ4344264.1 thiamine pyrophosphate-dependent enzyme [Candidatus Binatia bacterium]
MKRFECLQAIAPLINNELFVTTAGGATAEWNAVRPSDGNIQVKTLGLCSSIGLGLAIALPRRKVFVFDGDGALWMNLGSLPTIGLHQPRNLIHICWDNHQYESSGGEPTAATADNLDFAGVARSAGIKSSRAVNTVDELKEAIRHALNNDGPHFICARIEAGRAEAPPLKYDELENKYRFIRYIEETEGVSILRIAMPASYLLK